METTTTQTKVCSKCGRELPLTAFYHNAKGKFGVTSECRECHRAYLREHYARKRAANGQQFAPPLYPRNPELCDKQPREIIAQVKTLINELRARGYDYKNGKLMYLQVINL